ncbi:MAG: amidase [Deltaproteobacteria bacterium]|nr:amidase [Deltaproteobacteria bacterium]
MSDLLDTHDATALAALVRANEVTPLELVDAAIARIEAENPCLNAVVTPMFEAARTRARGPLPDGPFRGVPFLIKDLGPAYAGVRMTGGSTFLAEYVPDWTGELVTRFEAAGLVVVGKTNTPEFGIVPTTESKHLGPCKNPWDLSRSPGGSSGGSAAAVAARLVPMAHANDGGGSIRIPASCCGVFGLKPTRARTPVGPRLGDIMSGLVCDHAVTRSVRDSAALLDATDGLDLGGPYVAPPKSRPFQDEVGAPPGKLRVALMTSSSLGTPVAPECVRAAEDAAKLCEELGHEVTLAAPKIDGYLLTQAFMAVWTSGLAMTIAGYTRLVGRAPADDELEPLTRAYLEMGQRVKAHEYLLAVAHLQQLTRTLAAFMAEFDVLLTPVLGELPLPLGELGSLEPGMASARAAQLVPFTPLANVTGQPAMSVPLAWSEGGLPVGSHFIARRGEEATLFRLAGQLEAARPWADRRPSGASARR